MKHLFFLIFTTGASAGASSTSNAQVFGLGNAFKMPEGGWDCDACLLQNKAADVQCVACQAVKPGAKVEPKGNNSYLNNKVTHSVYLLYIRVSR